VLFTGLHLAINWGWIVAAFKKRINSPKQGKGDFSLQPVSLFVRSGILILAAGVVSITLYTIIGSPSQTREYKHNEIARFNPDLGHGLVQLLSETFLIALVVFIARKWLRLRL
jgi:hypothetical protein